mmetsp:Transcript_23926/g.80354  ORF Transcript_23926/g.80354 Transcript_23926/m.80354 type:complete len:145 (+) Transcript_23926:241-675(+)
MLALRPARPWCPAQVNKLFKSLADDNASWVHICSCGCTENQIRCGSCKTHIRDEFIRRRQCAALVDLIRAQARRRRNRERFRRVKQILLPLLQMAFVTVIVMWPWPWHSIRILDRHRFGAQPFIYASWDASHQLSPSIRHAAAP